MSDTPKKPKLDLSMHGVSEGIPGGGPGSQILNTAINGRKSAYREIALDEITPRPINRFRQANIERLARSIETTGLINPIVVVRPQNLPEESEVLKAFREKGIDISALKYVIVSGERRYRAVRFLHDAELNDPKKISPFDYKYRVINARVLTKDEAKNEELIYTDSNIETRQLSPMEVLINCRDILEGVDTPEKQEQALVEMGLDPHKAKFSTIKYCKYVFDHELGIQNVSEPTIMQHLATISGCPGEVIDAVIDGQLSPGKTRLLRQLPKDRQKELVRLLQEGRDKDFDLQLEELTGNKNKVADRYTHRDAAKLCQSTGEKLKKVQKTFELYLKNLSGDDEKNVNEILSDLKKTIDKLEDKYKKLW